MRPVVSPVATDDERAPAVKRCLACGASGVASRCGGCRRVFFCDRECQRRAWAEHRAECFRIRAEAQQAEAVRIPDAEEAAVGEQREHVEDEDKREEQAEMEMETAVQGAESGAAAAAHKKKSKSKHKRKKARSKSLHLPSGAGCPTSGGGQRGDGDSSLDAKKRRSVSLGGRKHVMWGQVLAREFERFPGGGSAVPYDGTWALGLGSPVADVTLGSVLEVEELKNEELKLRAKDLPKTQRALVREGETRQFDYRRGVDNPLFSRLTERERKQLFIAEKMPSPLLLAKSPPKHEHQNHNHHGRRRKNSVSASPVITSMSAPFVLDDAPLDSPDFACVSVEQLQEFAKIRDSRDEECGCSCGDLVKKVGKMHVKKLVTFLHERGVEDTQGLGKPQLMALAKKVAGEEKNCQTPGSDCECARNGVPCHSDVCLGCAGDCYNPFNCYQYKKDEVRAYRKQMIAAWKAQHDDSETLGEALGPAVQVA